MACCVVCLRFAIFSVFCSGATVAGSLGCHSLLQRRLLLSSFPAQTTVHIICLKVCPFSDAARATFLPTFAAVSINRWGPVRCLAQRGTPPPLGSFVGYWRRWFALLLPIGCQVTVADLSSHALFSSQVIIAVAIVGCVPTCTNFIDCLSLAVARP